MALKAGYVGIKRNLMKQLADKFNKLDVIIPSGASAEDPLALQSEIDAIWSSNARTGVHNQFLTKLHVADTYYLKQDAVITLPAGDYILSFNNASDKTVKYWATGTSDITDKGDKFVNAGETATQNYTVGSGGKVEFAFRFDPQDASISTSSVTEIMIRSSQDTCTDYTDPAMTNGELTEKVQGIIDAANNAADFAAFKTAIGNL